MVSQILTSLRIGITNVYLIRKERTVIVDTSTPGNAEKIVQAMAKEGVKPEQVSLILITHGHADHFGSAAELGKLTGAPVAMHSADAAQLRSGRNPSNPQPLRLMARLIKLMNPKATPHEPEVLLDGETDLTSYGVEAKVIPTPGHTPGSISVLLPGGDVLVGDALSGGMISHTPGYPMFATNITQMQASIRQIVALASTTIYPAHGNLTNAAAVQERFGKDFNFD